jgi:hypothetical protein
MRSLLSTTAALTMLCGAALAQTSTSGSTSGANVNTNSGSQSNSISNPSVNVYGNPIGNGASSSNSSAAGRSNSNTRSGAAASSGQSSSTSGVIVNSKTTSGTTGTSTGTDPAASSAAATTGNSITGTNFTNTQTLRNTPEIIPPSIVGGDPCTVGASGGVTLPGFGIVTGGSWEGKACERRQLAALLFNMGHGTSGARGDTLQEAAVEVLCVEAGVREALKRIGQPCVADRGVGSPTPSPTSFAAPKIAVAIATPSPPESAVPRQHPDWCYTASAQERRGHKVCGE